MDHHSAILFSDKYSFMLNSIVIASQSLVTIALLC